MSCKSKYCTHTLPCARPRFHPFQTKILVGSSSLSNTNLSFDGCDGLFNSVDMLGYEVATAGRAMSRTRSADDVGEPRQQRSNHSKKTKF